MILIPVCFSYSAASFCEKKSSNGLMKELSRATVIDLGAAPARETPRAAAVPPTTLTVRKSRRVVIASSDRVKSFAALLTPRGPSRSLSPVR